MKAFIASCLAAIVIGVAAAFVLNFMGFSSADVYSAGSVRL